MFDILIYLFETYQQGAAGNIDDSLDQQQLTAELTQAGFMRDDINKALDWMESLTALQGSDTNPYLTSMNPSAIRIYTTHEMIQLDTACRGFLLFLERICILNPATREMVIDRVREIEPAKVTLENLKLVVLMVLFNVPGNEVAYQQMEAILFESDNLNQH